MVADSMLPAAIDALIKKGYVLCTDPDCKELTGYRRFDHALTRYPCHPIADAHFHVPTRVPYHVVSLIRQSAILWWLPELTLEMPGNNDEFFTLSTDQRVRRNWYRPLDRGSGPRTDYPVRIPNYSTLVEAILMHYMLRYEYDAVFGNTSDHLGHLKYMWLEMADHLANQRQVSGPGPGRGLREEFQFAWDSFCLRVEPGEKEYCPNIPLLRLRQWMIGNGRLPSNLETVKINYYGHEKVPTHRRDDYVSHNAVQPPAPRLQKP